jgi:hypothetical protein
VERQVNQRLQKEIEGRKGEAKRESVQCLAPEGKAGIEKETVTHQGGKTKGENQNAVSLI